MREKIIEEKVNEMEKLQKIIQNLEMVSNFNYFSVSSLHIILENEQSRTYLHYRWFVLPVDQPIGNHVSRI
jgi:hypothetical protein